MNFTEDFSGQGWHHDVTVYPVGGEPYLTQVGNIFVPDGWSFAFWHGLPVDHDPTNEVGWAQHEGRYVHKADFPNRVHTGDHAWMFFGFWKIVHGVLYRSFQVTPGQALSASAQVHAWSSNSDDPNDSSDGEAMGNARFRIGIDPTGNTDIRAASIVWSEAAQIYDAYGQIRIDQVVAQGDWVTLSVRGLCKYPLKHGDFYLDWIELWTEDAPVWYPPRIDYARMYHLIGHDATQAQFLEVAETAFASQSTIGFSADDAGIGPPIREIIAHWPTPDSWSSKDDLEEFFDTHYPGAQLTQVDMDSPDGPQPPDPEPPHPGDPPVPNEFASPWSIGMHTTWLISGLADEDDPENSYIGASRPRVMKQTIGGGENSLFSRMWSDVKTVWRNVHPHGPHFISDHGFTDTLPPKEAAEICFQTYVDRGLWEWIDHVWAIESVNEVVACSDSADKSERVVAFEIAFIEKVRQECGDAVKAMVFNTAYGNPQPWQFEQHYLPMVQAAVDNKALLGYHGYWHGGVDESWLEQTAEDLAFRWAVFDEICVRHGLYPEWVSGEAGLLRTTEPYGGIIGAWRAGVGWERYRADLDLLDTMTAQWNAEHQNRFWGWTIFTVGGEKWDEFYLEKPQFSSLIDLRREKYG